MKRGQKEQGVGGKRGNKQTLLPMPLKMLAIGLPQNLILVPLLLDELWCPVTGSPKPDKHCGYTVVSSIASPYNYLRAPKHRTFL